MAIFAVPISLLAPLYALALWNTLNIYIIYLNITIVSRLVAAPKTRKETSIQMVLALLFIPTLHLLFEGQYNLVMLSLFLGSMLYAEARPNWLSGVLLAFTLGKPQTSWLLACALLLWLFWRKRWQPILGFWGCSVILWVGPLLYFPTWWRDWMEIALGQSVKMTHVTPSIWGVLAQLLPPSTANQWSLGLSLVVLIGLGVWWVRKVALPQTEIWETALITMVSISISIYGLWYEQVFLLFPFWLCWHWANARWRLILICWILIIPVSNLLWVLVSSPNNLVWAVLQPLSLVPIYIHLKRTSRSDDLAQPGKGAPRVFPASRVTSLD